MSKDGNGSGERDEHSRTVSGEGEGQRTRQFRLGGLTLELSGVSADIDELALGVEPIDLGVSAPADSGAERDDGSNEGEGRETNSRRPAGYGARLGAFLGREVGLFFGRIFDRGLRVLWNRVKTRRGKWVGERTAGTAEADPSSEDEPAAFDDELLARLGRVVDRDSSEN